MTLASHSSSDPTHVSVDILRVRIAGTVIYALLALIALFFVLYVVYARYSRRSKNEKGKSQSVSSNPEEILQLRRTISALLFIS